MRRRQRGSRIFAACAWLTVLVGVATMLGTVELAGHVVIGHGALSAVTTNSVDPGNVGLIPRAAQ